MPDQNTPALADLVEAERKLVAAVISCYHTTRLRDADPVAHVLSKPMVKSMLDAHRRAAALHSAEVPAMVALLRRLASDEIIAASEITGLLARIDGEAGLEHAANRCAAAISNLQKAQIAEPDPRDAEIDRLREALAPFARECDAQERVTSFRDGDCVIPRSKIKIKELRRARAALAKSEGV